MKGLSVFFFFLLMIAECQYSSISYAENKFPLASFIRSRDWNRAPITSSAINQVHEDINSILDQYEFPEDVKRRSLDFILALEAVIEKIEMLFEEHGEQSDLATAAYEYRAFHQSVMPMLSGAAGSAIARSQLSEIAPLLLQIEVVLAPIYADMWHENRLKVPLKETLRFAIDQKENLRDSFDWNHFFRKVGPLPTKLGEYFSAIFFEELLDQRKKLNLGPDKINHLFKEEQKKKLAQLYRKGLDLLVKESQKAQGPRRGENRADKMLDYWVQFLPAGSYSLKELLKLLKTEELVLSASFYRQVFLTAGSIYEKKYQEFLEVEHPFFRKSSDASIQLHRGSEYNKGFPRAYPEKYSEQAVHPIFQSNYEKAYKRLGQHLQEYLDLFEFLQTNLKRMRQPNMLRGHLFALAYAFTHAYALPLDVVKDFYAQWAKVNPQAKSIVFDLALTDYSKRKPQALKEYLMASYLRIDSVSGGQFTKELSTFSFSEAAKKTLGDLLDRELIIKQMLIQSCSGKFRVQ